MVATLMLLDLLSECLRLKREATALVFVAKIYRFLRLDRVAFGLRRSRDAQGRWISGHALGDCFQGSLTALVIEEKAMIASRTLTLAGDAGDKSIAIRVHAPVLDVGHWLCRYEIEWPDGIWKSAGAGVDSVQALFLTLQKIGSEIYTSDYHQSGKLFWDKRGNGYGFPVPKNLRDVLVGDDKLFEG